MGCITDHETLARIASFWHQGLLASPRHPSLAAVAYTAAMEWVAAWFADHGVARIPAGGVRRQVDAAIAIAASPEEAEILEPLYALRSGTAHGGQLHNVETVTGASFTLRYTPGYRSTGMSPVLQSDLTDPLQMFTRRLQTARHVARQLILQALEKQETEP